MARWLGSDPDPVKSKMGAKMKKKRKSPDEEPALSAYELKRLENIKRNAGVLKELNIEPLLPPPPSATKANKKSKVRAARETPTVPTRCGKAVRP